MTHAATRIPAIGGNHHNHSKCICRSQGLSACPSSTVRTLIPLVDYYVIRSRAMAGMATRRGAARYFIEMRTTPLQTKFSIYRIVEFLPTHSWPRESTRLHKACKLAFEIWVSHEMCLEPIHKHIQTNVLHRGDKDLRSNH